MPKTKFVTIETAEISCVVVPDLTQQGKKVDETTTGSRRTYRQISRQHSRGGIAKANHIPAYSTTKGTQYDIGQDKLPVLSTDGSSHPQLEALTGTAGRSNVRSLMHRYIQLQDLVTAVKIQTLWDYGLYPRALPDYQHGLELVIRHLRTLTRRDGQPFLTTSKVAALIEWLRREVKLCTKLGDEDYKSHVEEEITRYRMNLPQ